MNLPPQGEFTSRALNNAEVTVSHNPWFSTIVCVTYDELERAYGAENLYSLELSNFQLMAHNLKAGFLNAGYEVGELSRIDFDENDVGFLFNLPSLENQHLTRQAFINRIKAESAPSPKP